jgi:hypothetical protein
LAFPAYWFFASTSSVSALSMNTSTDSAGLFLMMMMSLSSHNVHLHGGLVLDVLVGGEGGEGGEGGASSVLLSTASSSGLSPNYTLSNLFLNTFTAIFLDSARVFLVAAMAPFPAVCFPR